MALIAKLRSSVFALSLSASAQTPTFTRDIAPILSQHCAACHRPGEAGPFSLLTYADAKKRAAQIAAVTGMRFMPPWLPQAGYGDFAEANVLTADQIKAIADWARSGAPEGSSTPRSGAPEGSSTTRAGAPEGSGTPPVPQFTSSWQLGTPELILEPKNSYTLPASSSDQYWNFVFRPQLKTTRYVRAIEIRPGERRLVHHANLLVDRNAQQNPEGFGGMDLTVMRSPFDPVGQFLFWKPGALGHVEPDGYSWRLDPGNELVLNAHLQPSGKPETVRPSIGLYFTDQPPAHFPILIQMENDAGLNIPAGARDFLVRDDFRLPLDADVLAIYPHAHFLGKLLEAYATLPGGEKKWLIRIPDWNQNWQSVFYYREPVFLPRGSLISMRYHYDNSPANVRNPNHPPKRVTAGNLSTDEMAHLWLELLPRGKGDQRRVLEEAILRRRLDHDSASFETPYNLGVVLLSRLKVSEGVDMLRTAVDRDPKRPEAHTALGIGLAHLGLMPEATRQFEIALQLKPDDANARFHLAEALLKANRLDDAIENFRQVTSAYPDDETARDALQNALQEKARRDANVLH